jgi:hypothetical protein
MATSWHLHQKTISIQKQENLIVKVNDDTTLSTTPISPAAYRRGTNDTKCAHRNHVATASQDKCNGASDIVT